MHTFAPYVIRDKVKPMTRGWGWRIRQFIWRRGTDYLFVTPYFIHFLLFLAFPIVFCLMLSFTDWNLYKPTRNFIGLGNYEQLLLRDKVFLRSIGNTLYFVVFRVTGVAVLGLGMAVLLNQRLHGIRLFRTVFYFPVVVDWVIASLVWLFLLEPSIGLINQFLLSRRYQPQPFFNSTTQAMPLVILMSIWKDVAYYAIIYLAGLQDVPEELVEAAQIDGASRWQTFWHVTLPWISPVTLFVIIIASINSLRVFVQIYILTEGGPLNATISVMFYLYNQAFRYMQMGYGSTIALIFFIIVMVLVLIQRKVLGTFGRTMA